MFIKKTGILLASSLLVSISFSAIITAKETSAESQLSFKVDPASNNLHMLTSKQGGMAFTRQAGESTADAVKRQFAHYFGINNPATELMVTKDFSPAENRQTIRYQQVYNGVPVVGGELVANLKSQKLTSISGETSKVSLTNLEQEVDDGVTLLIHIRPHAVVAIAPTVGRSASFSPVFPG